MSAALIVLLCACCALGGVLLGFALGEKVSKHSCKFLDRFER